MTSTYGPLLDQIRGVRWPTRRAVGAGLPGIHRSLQRGSSGEFTEYRLYRQGDDPRQLDWRLLARSDRAFVRLTDDRALLPTWLLVDGSASMAFPDVDVSGRDGEAIYNATKWRLACSIAVALAAVANASADPVGALCTSVSGEVRLPARARRGTINELGRMLEGLVPGGSAPLAPLLATLKPRARVIVISDLLGDIDELLLRAGQLAAAGGIIECVHVVAQAELAPPDRALLAQDPEAVDVQRVFDGGSLADYRRNFDAFRLDVARRWRAIGARYNEVRTGEQVPRMIRQIVSLQG